MTHTVEDRLAGLNLSENGVLDLSCEYEGAPLPEQVMAAVEASLDQGETHYTTRPGLPALARAIAQKLEREQGLTLDPSWKSSSPQAGARVSSQPFRCWPSRETKYWCPR